WAVTGPPRDHAGGGTTGPRAVARRSGRPIIGPVVEYGPSGWRTAGEPIKKRSAPSDTEAAGGRMRSAWANLVRTGQPRLGPPEGRGGGRSAGPVGRVRGGRRRREASRTLGAPPDPGARAGFPAAVIFSGSRSPGFSGVRGGLWDGPIQEVQRRAGPTPG